MLTMSGQNVPKSRKESIRDRLEHDENAWAEMMESLHREISQMFGYNLRLEKRIKQLELDAKITKHQIRLLISDANDKKPKT